MLSSNILVSVTNFQDQNNSTLSHCYKINPRPKWRVINMLIVLRNVLFKYVFESIIKYLIILGTTKQKPQRILSLILQQSNFKTYLLNCHNGS